MELLPRAKQLCVLYDINDQASASIRSGSMKLVPEVGALMARFRESVLSDVGIELFFGDEPERADRFRQEMATFAMKAAMCTFNATYCEFLSGLGVRLSELDAQRAMVHSVQVIREWLEDVLEDDAASLRTWRHVLVINLDLIVTAYQSA